LMYLKSHAHFAKCAWHAVLICLMLIVSIRVTKNTFKCEVKSMNDLYA